MGRTLFVYWTLEPGLLAEALQRTRAAQAALREHHPGLATELWCREGGDPARATVMEVYRLPGGVHAAAEATIEGTVALALAGLPAGPRHVEAFSPA